MVVVALLGTLVLRMTPVDAQTVSETEAERGVMQLLSKYNMTVEPSFTTPLMTGVRLVPDPAAGTEPVAAGDTDAAVMEGTTESTVAVTLEALGLPAGSVTPEATRVGLIVPLPAEVTVTKNLVASPESTTVQTVFGAEPALLISPPINEPAFKGSENTIVYCMGGVKLAEDFTNDSTVGAVLSFVYVILRFVQDDVLPTLYHRLPIERKAEA